MTKKEMFAEIRKAVASNEEMVAFIDREIELLNRKSSAPKKPTKRQLENEGLKDDICVFLAIEDTMKSISEIKAGVPSLTPSDITGQRITHLLTALIKEGKIAKKYVKKKPYYYTV